MNSHTSLEGVEKEPVVTDIITAISEAENVDATELPPLYDAIDTDALERLIRSTDEQLSVVFTYRQWTVKVRCEDAVEVTIFPDGG